MYDKRTKLEQSKTEDNKYASLPEEGNGLEPLRYEVLIQLLKKSCGRDEGACKALAEALVDEKLTVKENIDPLPYYIFETLNDFAKEGKEWAVDLMSKITNRELCGENAQVLYQVEHDFYLADCDSKISIFLADLYYDFDIKQSIKWYGKAAEWSDNSAKANYELGYIYLKGIEVDRDEKKAFNYFEIAARHRNNSAMYKLIQCYLYGVGVDQDEDKALKLHQELLHTLEVKYSRELPLEDKYLLAKCYQFGHGTKKEDKKAFTLFKEAAECGHMKAQYELGKCYAKGIGTPTDYHESVKYYEKAAKQGYAKAQYALAKCLAEGIGLPKDEKKAFEYYKAAAEQKDARALYELARCYSEGIGTPTDDKKAHECYKAAAELGSILARYVLSTYDEQ